MKIIITVGHSILKNGASTSADGRPFDGVLEYAYNKEIVEKVAGYLRSAGHETDVLICPEKKFTNSTEEKSYKLSRVNNGGYGMVAELHLNASAGHNARGCEVLYLSEKGRLAAQKIQERLATVFEDRGIQKRPELYMLNKTVPTAVMVESFFCDNVKDCALAGKTNVALLIAEGIHGGKIAEDHGSQEEGKRLYHVQAGGFSVRQNAEKLKEKLLEKGFDALIVTANQGGVVYQVQTGVYNKKENAQVMEQNLRAAGFDALIVQSGTI